MRACQACDERVRDTGGGKPAQASEAVRGVHEGCEHERARASEAASERRGLRELARGMPAAYAEPEAAGRQDRCGVRGQARARWSGTYAAVATLSPDWRLPMRIPIVRASRDAGSMHRLHRLLAPRMVH